MRRTLVVDDNAVNRKLAVALLKRRGWQTEEAENGRAALNKLAESAMFDSVLLDISMPELDGEEVCRRIRASSEWQTLRVVAYTAHAMESEKTRIMSAGFDDILIKPITARDLARALPD